MLTRLLRLVAASAIATTVTAGCQKPDPGATPEGAAVAAGKSVESARSAADETKKRLDDANQTLGQR